ncbi:SDR family oxidoreductase [Fundicoccus sp. Sow4_F4]|uniref:SDR family oxidoreductase n=1 Tax=Fundicoccus sp. Sow4_F4 TaxID=3438783 RepID=UPI003F92CF69
MKKSVLNDPRVMYHSDKFPVQKTQAEPALQSQMQPRPDCGEASYVGTGKLLNRKALVTGADSGIGRAAAIAFAREGCDVAIQFVPGEEADAKEVKGYIEDEGRQAFLLPCDLRDEGAASWIVHETVDAFGGLDLLVLNSAMQVAIETLADLPIQQVEDTFKVNVISMFESVQAAQKHLLPGSSIITTTSSQSFDPSPQLLDYAATKSAISNLTVNLAQYFADKGVRVNAVSPGPVWTPLQLNKGQLPGQLPNFGQGSLIGRAGQPAELAHMYVYLASDDASFVTGQIYGINGGTNINL